MNLSPAIAALKRAGREEANRTTIVVKRPARQQDPASQVPVIPTLRVGARTMPDWRYSGPANRLAPSDPHEAIESMHVVGMVLKYHPNLKPVFDRLYVREQIERYSDRRDHWELKRLVAAEIGEVSPEIAERCRVESIAEKVARDRALEAIRKRRYQLKRKAQLAA